MNERAQILIVEDDSDIRESLCDALESEGYRVVAARHGREGLELLSSMEEPGLILLDLMMPVMGGAEFLTILRGRDRFAALPVVVISAWPREARAVRDMTQGFIAKPVDLGDLLEVVERFCGGADAGVEP